MGSIETGQVPCSFVLCGVRQQPRLLLTDPQALHRDFHVVRVSGQRRGDVFAISLTGQEHDIVARLQDAG